MSLHSWFLSSASFSQVAQAGNLFDPTITMDDYLLKSFNKTATLIAASCKSAAVFSGVWHCSQIVHSIGMSESLQENRNSLTAPPSPPPAIDLGGPGHTVSFG